MTRFKKKLIKSCRKFENEDIASCYPSSNEFKIKLKDGNTHYQYSGRYLDDINEELNKNAPFGHIFIGSSIYSIDFIDSIEFLGIKKRFTVMKGNQ